MEFYPNPNTSAAFWCNTTLQTLEAAAACMATDAEQGEEYMLATTAAKLFRLAAHFHACAGEQRPRRRPAPAIMVAAPRNPATAEAAWYGVQRSAAAFGNLSRNCRFMRGAGRGRIRREQYRYMLQWIASAWVLDALYFGIPMP